MIFWEMIRLSSDRRSTVDLLSGERWRVNETDAIQFLVSIDRQTHKASGAPYIVVGDVPIEMSLLRHDDQVLVYASASVESWDKANLLYNFFGESEVCLCFEGGYGYEETVLFDVQARPKNAALAEKMLRYLTEHLDDVTALCFSRSRIGINDRGIANSATDQLKMTLLRKIIDFLSSRQAHFFVEHHSQLVNRLHVSSQGRPTGPDSVYWALTHLDQATTARIEEANFVSGNRAYRFHELPSEQLEENSDTFENRVIHGFFAVATDFLGSLAAPCQRAGAGDLELKDSEGFVNFERIVSKYQEAILKHQSLEAKKLLQKLSQLQHLFARKVPAKAEPGLRPTLTSYVRSHEHYRTLFEYISRWYKAPAPKLNGSEILLGLKNLSAIYELNCLVLFSRTLLELPNVEFLSQEYRVHSESLPFGGGVSERPVNLTNNYYHYRQGDTKIELYYEPLIHEYREGVSRPSDLIDVSGLSGGYYGRHYFCPDFVLKITHPGKRSFVVVADAKYSDAKVVREKQIANLTQRYLLGIHQFNGDGHLAMSPVKALLLLFAHKEKGQQVLTVGGRYSLSGNCPVLPQAAGLYLLPDSVKLFRESISSLLELSAKT